MEVVRRGDAPVHMHFLADASRRAMIELYTNPAAPTDVYKDLHPTQLHIAFTSADPDADAARLVAAGATLVEHLHNPDGSHLTMLRDPVGPADPAREACRADAVMEIRRGSRIGDRGSGKGTQEVAGCRKCVTLDVPGTGHRAPGSGFRVAR